MIDGGLRPMFRERLRHFHWNSIETTTISGVPDAEACFEGSQFWIEYKFTTGWTVGLRPEQIGWALRRARAGGRSFIAVRRTAIVREEKFDELYLFRGADAGRLAEGGLRAVEPLERWSGGPARWNWERVSDLLLLRDLSRAPG
jgi:hypothetical protein